MLTLSKEELEIFNEETARMHNTKTEIILKNMYRRLIDFDKDLGKKTKVDIIYKRAMRLIEEICRINKEFQFSRDIDSILVEALQSRNDIKGFNLLLVLDKEKFSQYIKELESKSIEKIDSFIRLRSNILGNVHESISEALWKMEDILTNLDLSIQESPKELDEVANEEDFVFEDENTEVNEELDVVDEEVEDIVFPDLDKEELDEEIGKIITPEEFKKFAELMEILPQIAEIKQNIDLEFAELNKILKQKKLEDFKKNHDFISDLEVIMSHDKKQSQYHYHGTQDLETAGKILEQGLLMTRDLSSTSYPEFTMDELLLYQRGGGGEIGSSGIVVIDQPIVEGKRKEIVEKLEQNHGYSFEPSGLQGLNNEPENIVQTQYIVGYVDKINRKVVLNPLYYDYQNKLAEIETKRKLITQKTELDGVDILTAASSAEVDKCDEMDRVLGTVTKELVQGDKNQEIEE